MALMPIIRQYGCFGVFLEANNDVLYRNRYIRETEFGFSKTEIDAKFIRLMEYDYKFYIQPQIHFADLVITVESDYRFSSIKSQITNSVLPE
jgi:uridine kinase